MTTEHAMAQPHSHGAVEKGGHASRADRPVSFDLDAIPVPRGREEDWRFTPMRRVERLFDPANYDEGDAPIAVEAPEGVGVETVSREDARLGTVLAPGDRTSVVAWNAFTSSTVVTVPKGAVLAEPIRIAVDAVEGTRPQHLRIDVGELAEATIIVSHRGSPEAALNQTIEFSAGDASNVTLVSIQEWDESTLHASNHRLALGKDAKLTHIVVTFGGDTVRICSDTDFRGTGGELTMLGLYFVDGGQHLEHRVFVDHSQPNCYSRVTYKGALQGADAHSVWIGDCLIREAADDTDTYELNRNLVLTEGAKADSVPNLEIENGEIKGAGHASATGRFDDEQLFYLMSRGISEHDARRLVVRGFFAELINQIGVPEVVDHLMESVEAELAKSRTI
ncbi:Fe-S cluster assembly protein SufD [Actinomyces culturomici]|uniref:Fe-S cluster assembly protein SufD n=1 Tax=Actinomyces culturomici TaxID=1926276 RepID=UPI000E209CB5|nr:Fe-S cluster assembly protein SufD [Actinomyces culturomici]